MRILFFLLFVVSCARSPIKRIDQSMRPVTHMPEVVDSLSRESFFQALRKHIDVMKTSAQVKDPMIFGERKIEKIKYIASLEEIFSHQENWNEWIKNNFDFFEVYGRDEWGDILATGYYEPQVAGSKIQTSKFSQALFSPPNDLVSVNLKLFGKKFAMADATGMMTGRLQNKSIVPYYDRSEIDGEKKLKGQNLELAWVDPIDAFFIQIQGSGLIEFENGETLRVGYANQNGHPYKAIGKFLTDVIPMEQMSMQKIKAHLQTLPKNEQQTILNKNPSYVFFKKLGSASLTYAGMEVSDGRTIATDLKLFPKGAMAFLDIEEPVFETTASVTSDVGPVSWEKLPRFVFDQDTGGAIIGPDRVDLYFGKGPMASQKAGVMKRKGRLYYLVPKKNI